MSKPVINYDKCVRCGVCITSCPAESILWNDGDVPEVIDDCAECGRCLEWCPAGAIE